MKKFRFTLLIALFAGWNAFAYLELPTPAPSVSPGDSLGNDLDLPYQWALKNQGQIAIKKIDDLHSERINGVPGYDLDLPAGIDSLMKKETVVAIIDSGVDATHEDLQGSLLPGLDFTVNPPAQIRQDGESAQSKDEIGHGTHLASLIAATMNNHIGIRGLSNRVKILPLEVLSQHSSTNTLTDRVTLAIHYAIEHHADVINLSMGWAYEEDKPALRAAFQDAQNHGMLIVAAAGNDGISAPVMPCAYPGVVCVGAADLRGAITSYSGFGGQVDFLAPGDEILGAIPEDSESKRFEVQGYDLMSGSSQASAYVSGLFAILRGIFPGEPWSALYLRLAMGARLNGNVPSEHFTLHGIPSLRDALSEKPRALIQPIFKDQAQVAFTLSDPKSSFPLRIECLGMSAEAISIQVSSKPGSAAKVESRFTIDQLSAGETRDLSVPVDILDANSDNSLSITVEIQSSVGHFTYRQDLVLVREITAQDPRRTLKVEGLDPSLRSRLQTLQDPGFQLGDSAYYLYEIGPSGMKFSFYRVYDQAGREPCRECKDGALRMSGQTSIKDAVELKGVYLADMNLDGVPDLLIETKQSPPGQPSYFQFTLLDLSLQPLFGSHSEWKYWPEADVFPDMDHFTVDPAAFSYIPSQIDGLGKVAIPVQVMSAKIPEPDQAIQDFSTPDTSIKKRVYALKPVLGNDGVRIETRLLKDVESAFGAGWRASVEPLTAFGAPAQALVSVKDGGEIKIYRSNVQNPTPQLPQLIDGWNADLTQADFSNRAIQVSPAALASGQAQTASELLTANRLSWSLFSSSGQPRSQIFEVPDLSDPIEAFLGIAYDGSQTRAYVLTQYHLIEQTLGADGSISLQTLPITRFSYIPEEDINQIYIPIYGGDQASSFPAFYVDASKMNSSFVYVLSSEGGKLQAPARLSIRVPKNCSTLTPGYRDARHQSVVSFACEDSGGVQVLQLPIESEKPSVLQKLRGYFLQRP